MLRILNFGAPLALPILVVGCASIFDGTTQQIAVNTNPSDAQCKFWRNGAVIADIASTPSAVTIQKSKHDIKIVCTKPGYVEATYMNKSGVAGATFANILGGVVTGGIAWAVDSGSGADNKYDGQINLSLAPVGGVVPADSQRLSSTVTPVPSSTPVASPAAPAGVTPGETTPAASGPAEIECTHSSGARTVVSGTCPAGWTVVR